MDRLMISLVGAVDDTFAASSGVVDPAAEICRSIVLPMPPNQGLGGEAHDLLAQELLFFRVGEVHGVSAGARQVRPARAW